jgi:predicted Zn-dependent protease
MNRRLCSLLLAALLAAPAAFALDLGGLGKALGNPEKLTKSLDAAKNAGQMLKGVAGIGPEEEKLIGESVALEIVGKYGGLVRDDAIMQRVNLVGRGLALYSARPELDWRFGVLDSDTVNAFSAPAGYVFITRGLYVMASNDDTLAAILGHEIAHITGKHALNIIARGEFLSGATSLAAARSEEVRRVDSQLKTFDLGVSQVTKTLFEKGFDPQTEYAADVTGRDLAVTTGYAPGGLRAVLTALQRTPAGQQKIFSTHPPLAERIKRLPADAAPLPPGAAAKSSSPAQETPAVKAAPEVDDDDRAFAAAAETPKKKGKN